MAPKIGTFTLSNGTVDTQPNLFTNKTSQPIKSDEIVASGVIRRNETPYSDEHFALMKAAANAGLPPAQQKKFADANADGKLQWTKGSDPTPKTDSTVRQEDYKALIGKTKSYKLSADQIADLNRRIAEYKAKGGKLFSNREVLPNPAEAVAVKNGISEQRISGTSPTDGIVSFGTTPQTRFSVFLNNNGKPITNERILAQFIEDRYKGGNLWGENFREIAQMSIGQGVKPTNINNKGNVGNKIAVYFDISVTDQKKIHENYKAVQAKVNEIEKIVESTRDNMALNQFLKGVGEGAWDTLKENWKMLTNPLETVQNILDAVKTLASLSKEDLINIIDQLKQSGSDLIYKDSPAEVANKAGKLVGMIAVEIALGKGVGLLLRGIKGIKAIESLVSKADDLAKLGKTKIAAVFSDEAAETALKRAQKRLATQMYSGIPADILADMAVVAGNKISKGVVKFSEFSRQMVQEFGDKIKPKLLELYQNAFEKVHGARKTLELDELLGGHSIEKHVGKSESWLRQRLINEPLVKTASSFRNYETANFIVGKAIKEHQAVITKWLEGGIERPLKLSVSSDKPVGIILERGKGGSVGLKTAVETNKAEVILVRDNTPTGWHILTSYPVN